MDASLKTFKEEIIPELGKERITANTSSLIPIPVATKRTRLRRRFATVLIAATVALLLGSTLVASALGYNIWAYVINWGKETFQIGSVVQVTVGPTVTPSGQSGASNVKPKKFKCVDDAIDAINVAIKVPKWFPSGFEFISADITESSQLKGLTAVYKSDNKAIIFTSIVYSTEEAAYSYEINEASGETTSIGGNTCYIMTNIDQTGIVWVNGNIVYSINGDVSKDDLTTMVNSIFKGDS